MKNTFKVFGIILIIGLSMVSCGGDDGGGGSSGGIRLVQTWYGQLNPSLIPMLEFHDSSNTFDIEPSDFTITIDGTPVTAMNTIGNSYNDVKRLTLNTRLAFGQRYDVKVEYKGRLSSIQAKFPFSGTLTCIEVNGI
jgi:hypothetical protein